MTTDNKTLAVDVLAVIDGLSALWRDESKIVGRWDSADELDSIRSAVAELIEADIAYDEAMKKRHSRAYLDCAQIKQRRIQQRLTDACHRRNKAVARVKGESA